MYTIRCERRLSTIDDNWIGKLELEHNMPLRSLSDESESGAQRREFARDDRGRTIAVTAGAQAEGKQPVEIGGIVPHYPRQVRVPGSCLGSETNHRPGRRTASLADMQLPVLNMVRPVSTARIG
jgi:hypothetical protein